MLDSRAVLSRCENAPLNIPHNALLGRRDDGPIFVLQYFPVPFVIQLFRTDVGAVRPSGAVIAA